MPRATSWAPVSLPSVILTAPVVVGACLAPVMPAGAADTASPPAESRFQKVLLANHSDLTQPMRMKVAPDGRVIFVECDGLAKLWEPSAKDVTVAGRVPVAAIGELGLVGPALARISRPQGTRRPGARYPRPDRLVRGRGRKLNAAFCQLLASPGDVQWNRPEGSST